MLKRLIIFITAIVLLNSCSDYSRVTRNGTIEEKYAAALKYYQEKDYYKSSTLMEEVISFKSGSRDFEDALFIFAESYFYQKQYLLANHYYQRFTEKFPRNEKVEEANFMAAKCLYMISPKVSLDQTETVNAISDFRDFLVRYPDSKYQEESVNIITEMEDKLEDKAYNTAKLHLKIKNYKAAVTSMSLFRKEYPYSNYNEELSYLKVQAQLELAKISLERIKKDGKVIRLKEDRYKEVKSFYHDFVGSYPESQYLRAVEGYYKQAINNTKIK